MNSILHITNGDAAGKSLGQSGIPGEVLAWRDILYEGPRNPGWPNDDTLKARARFLEKVTGGGLSREHILNMLKKQYRRLEAAAEFKAIVLWFDACLSDQSMLAHILTCLRCQNVYHADLLCIETYPGILPFDGIGQLLPEQLASLYHKRRPVTSEQFEFAETVDRAFAGQDKKALLELSKIEGASLPWVSAAVVRWLEELPDTKSGLGRLEHLVLAALDYGCETPAEIYGFVSANDTHPQYWGDITLWGKINGLADRRPPLLQIDGPASRLPLWEGTGSLKHFQITIIPKTKQKTTD